MRGLALWLSLVVVTLAGPDGSGHPSRQGVRVVDAVSISSAREEAAHGLAGEAMATGERAGQKWRSAAGWFSYALRIYDDTPVTVVCVFADNGGTREAFDVLVDGGKAASLVREPAGSYPRELRVSLPLAETFGKPEVTVTFRAHPGSRTARLLELRSIQEHLE